MKESQLYLKFLKDFWLLFVFFGLIGVIGSYYLLSRLPTVYMAERMYEVTYTLDTAVAVEKASEQIVTVLRASQLKEGLGIQSSEVVVFKPGPFALTLQVKNIQPEKTVNHLDTLGGYLTSKYQVNEVGRETFTIQTKPVLKYLLLGILAGEITALTFALAISYLKRF